MNKRRFLMAGVGIFLAGVLVGGAGMALFAKARLAPMVRMDKLGPAGFFLERLDFALNLTDQQKKTILPIIEDVMQKVHEARSPCLQAEEDALHAGNERIMAELTPEQAGKFTEFMAKVKARGRRFFGKP